MSITLTVTDELQSLIANGRNDFQFRSLEQRGYPAANFKGAELPQEVKPTHAPLVDGISVCGPLQFILRLDTQELIHCVQLGGISMIT